MNNMHMHIRIHTHLHTPVFNIVSGFNSIIYSIIIMYFLINILDFIIIIV